MIILAISVFVLLYRLDHGESMYSVADGLRPLFTNKTNPVQVPDPSVVKNFLPMRLGGSACLLNLCSIFTKSWQ